FHNKRVYHSITSVNITTIYRFWFYRGFFKYRTVKSALASAYRIRYVTQRVRPPAPPRGLLARWTCRRSPRLPVHLLLEPSRRLITAYSGPLSAPAVSVVASQTVG